MKSWLLLSSCFSFFTSFLSAQSPTIAWAKSVGGTGFDLGYSVAVDALGNVYTTGYFQGTADFDPGPGTFNLTAFGTEDIFISKLDASGNFLWVKQMGGSRNDVPHAIGLDAIGNVYTTGYFTGTADFDPGPEVFNLTNASGGVNSDIFVSKLDAAGNFMWAKQVTGVNSDESHSLTIDATGNSYTTGRFEGTVDFDTGPGTLNLTSAGSSDVFILKLDAAGNLLFAKQIGGNRFDDGNSITVGPLGSVYGTGYFTGTADFDPGTGIFNLTAAGEKDIFVFKLDAAGNFLWAKQMGGNTAEFDQGYSIAVDAVGNVYTTGNFYGTADFDPGVAVFNLEAAGGVYADDIFISKLDAEGNFVWAKRMGGNLMSWSHSIALDAAGNVYTTGAFAGSADFDPGSEVFTLTAAGDGNFTTDIFISKLDTAGKFMWAARLGEIQSERSRSIVLDASGNIYLTGHFQGTVDFDPGPSISNVTATEKSDIFVLKFRQTQAAALPVTFLDFSGKYINSQEVLLQWQTATEKNTRRFLVERATNAANFTTRGMVIAIGNSASAEKYSFTDTLSTSNPRPTIVLYRLKIMEADGSFTYSKTVAVRLNGSTHGVYLFPNPAKNMLYVQLARPTGNLTLLITDVTGKLVKQEKLNLAGNSSFTVDIHLLQHGKYYLILQGQEKKEVREFLKQ